MNKEEQLILQNAWETIAKHLANHEYATTFFINKETDHAIPFGEKDVSYTITFVNKKREFEVLLQSSNIVSITDVSNKIERNKDL